MTSNRTLLDVHDVRAGFGSNTVLHGCSYHVAEGEIAAVLGLNGAGKSVSVKVVGGLIPAWSGTVTFDGEDVTKLSADKRVARGMAHVPQGRQVFPELTVEQNLRLGAYVLRRRSLDRYDSVLTAAYERFPLLAKRRSQTAGSLSGGEQATLSVARAMMSEPKLLIVDEASAGLAPRMVENLFDTFRLVNQAGVSILMIEQNVTFTLELADRAHIMQQGRIAYEGKVESLDRNRVADLLGVGRLIGRQVKASRVTNRNGRVGSRTSSKTSKQGGRKKRPPASGDKSRRGSGRRK